MVPLNLEVGNSNGIRKSSKNKPLKIFAGVAALALVPFIGSTLAATITINTSGTVQFGQGVATAAACDSGLNISSTSVYSSDAFYLKTITISDIDLTSGCNGKTLTVSVADSSGAEVAVASSLTQISFSIPNAAGAASTAVTSVTSGATASNLVNASGVTYKTNATAVAYDDAGSVTLTITTPTLLTSNVVKFLIQSS